jgi:hypothetical protein
MVLESGIGAISLFSDKVDLETKREMALRFIRTASNEEVDRATRYTGNDYANNKTLDMFVGPSSALFFKILNLDTTFLLEDIGTWEK